MSDDGRSITPELSRNDLVAGPTTATLNSPRVQDAQETPTIPPVLTALTSTTSAPAAPQPVSSNSPKSPKSLKSPHHRPHARPTTAHSSPADRFRSSVRKVMHMNRSASFLAQGVAGGAGAEPGVDPRRESATQAYGHIQENCLIEVMDYSSVRHSFGRMSNKEFVELMGDSKASKPEHWVKVRWINIAGISWYAIFLS